MPERDHTDDVIATVFREEAERAGAHHVPPPLEQLRNRAATRRRRDSLLAGAAGLTAAAALGAVVWAALPGGDGPPPVPAGPVERQFPVPTYEWDEGGGHDALVTGALGFTVTGCPLLLEGDRATALFLPNAVGVVYDNGVRGVVDEQGRVYATEGQTMEYAGGWQEPMTPELAQRWEALCGDTPARDAVVVNSVAAHDPLIEPPPVPPTGLPTAPSTSQELGWFDVPTFEFDQDGPREDALVEGVVQFTDDGCPYVETDGWLTGLVFPNAEGFQNPDADEPRMVYTSFPDGSSGVMAVEGEPVSWGGGGGAADDERWTSVCSTPVDSVFLVQDTPFG